MKYVLNLGEDGRVLSASYFDDKKIYNEAVVAEDLPKDNIVDYLYVKGKYIYDPLPVIEFEDLPTELDKLDARITYIEIMTGILHA